MAWLALIGFVLLIVNLLIFKVQATLSAAVYVFIVIVFIITNPSKNKQINENRGNDNKET
jgi:hypothetical protein